MSKYTHNTYSHIGWSVANRKKSWAFNRVGQVAPEDLPLYWIISSLHQRVRSNVTCKNTTPISIKSLDSGHPSKSAQPMVMIGTKHITFSFYLGLSLSGSQVSLPICDTQILAHAITTRVFPPASNVAFSIFFFSSSISRHHFSFFYFSH